MTTHAVLWMTDRRLREAVILSKMACPDLDRLPPLRYISDDQVDKKKSKRPLLAHIDDANMQLNPSMMMSFMP